MKRTILRLFLVIAAVFAGWFLIPPPFPSYAADYSLRPVLFVHGSGLDSSTWGPMIRLMIQKGYPAAYLMAIDLRPDNGSNPVAAERHIGPAAESLLLQAARVATENGYSGALPDKIDIVAHSMGAFSSRWYIAHIAPHRVSSWIGIAGANFGTEALRGHPGSGNREMWPAFASGADQSEVQVRLNGTPDSPLDPTPYGVGSDPDGIPTIAPDSERRVVYWTIRIEPDRWIKPEKSAVLPGAGGVPAPPILEPVFQETSEGNFLFLGRREHDDLPKVPDVMLLAIALLRAGDAKP